MKKKAFAILTLCISLFAAVALVGCGGSGGATGSGGGGGAEKPAVDMRTDFIWFKVEVPEGVEITDVAGDTADRAQFKFTESEHASDRFIPVFDPDKNADELFDYEAKWKASSEMDRERSRQVQRQDLAQRLLYALGRRDDRILHRR
ncbi:MAG: hypothetical protein ACLUSU_00375 [Collinsella sp.]